MLPEFREWMINVSKLDTFAGHRDAVYTLAPSQYPNRFYSAGSDGLVVEWDLEKPDLGKLVARAGSSVYALAYDFSRDHLLVGQNFDGIQFVHPEQKALVGSVKVTASAIFDIQIYGNEAYLAFGDGVVGVMDLEHRAMKKHVKLSDKSARTLAVSPDGQHLTVGLSDRSVRVLERTSMMPVHSLQGHTNSVFTAVYTLDGNFLLTAGRDARFRVWDVRNEYQPVQEVVGHMYAINHIAFHPEGHLFATCSMDKSIKLWDAATFRLLKVIDRSRHAGHGTSVNKLYWTSFENLLISASDDRMLSVWEIREE